MPKMTTVKKTFWQEPMKIGVDTLIDNPDRKFVVVQFRNGHWHRTRKTYTLKQAEGLMDKIISHISEANFPWTDKQGVRQWTQYDPEGMLF